MFNLVDAKDGGKVDFWMLSAEPFDTSRFSRRMRELGLADLWKRLLSEAEAG